MNRERFFILSISALALARMADVAVTYQFSPGLALEGNPMVRDLGMGWSFLVSANLAATLLIGMCTWYWAQRPMQYTHAQEVHDVWSFASFACFRRVYPPATFVWRRIFCTLNGWKHTLQFFGVVIPPAFILVSGAAVFSWYAIYHYHWGAYCRFYAACWPVFPYVLVIPTIWLSAVVFYRNEYHCYQASADERTAQPATIEGCPVV